MRWLSPPSIFTRPKPLKPNTIRRILAGAVKYRWPQPYVDALQGLLHGMAPRLIFSRAEAIELGLVQPLTTSNKVALAEPFLVPNFGERDGQAPRVHGIDQPVPTITASGHIQLTAPSLDATDEVRIEVNYRMLHWRELARATSFDDEGQVYDFAGNATQITKQIGNAVPNRTAKALVRSLMRDNA